MIIPIRCLSCGHVIADKWNYYNEKCKSLESDEKNDTMNENQDKSSLGNKTERGKLMDELGLKRICCRRHFLGCVDMMELI
jgi:DNA-directed RNA polymerase subunit N (RpoN/RPB10)